MMRLYRFPVAATVAVLIAAFIFGGPAAAVTVGILAILEVSLSFDNAVVNASILGRMDDRWQRIFMTVGIAIAVFGMRLVFPLGIVSLTARVSPGQAVDMALHHPDAYAVHLTAAHPAIAAFGGMFLAMIFLGFLLDVEKDVHWISIIERPLARFGVVDSGAVIGAGMALLATATMLTPADEKVTVLVAGLAGIVTHLAVAGLGNLFESDDAATAGKAGLALFLYLEVLDASFSFDGVIGAFAITNQFLLIAAGLGVGAAYIRGMTVHLVRAGTLSELPHLEHGAHWAIGCLAGLLLVSIRHEVPEVITGLVGVGFIAASLVTSTVHNRRVKATHVATPAITHA